MADTAAFWNKRADKYSRQPVKDMENYRRTLDCTRKHLTAGDLALEVGCGTGTTALHLAPSVKQLTATDISSRMIEIAREKAAAQGVNNVRCEPATLFDKDLNPGPYDVVLAFNLLHLLEDLPGSLRRISELVRPGGLFISKTFCLGEKSGLWRIPLAIARTLGLVPHVNVLKITELEEMISGTGFEIVETGLHPSPSRFIVARKS